MKHTLILMLAAVCLVACNNDMNNRFKDDPSYPVEIMDMISEQTGEIDDEALLNDMKTKAFCIQSKYEYHTVREEWTDLSTLIGIRPIIGCYWNDTSIRYFRMGFDPFTAGEEYRGYLSTDIFYYESNIDYTYDAATNTISHDIVRTVVDSYDENYYPQRVKKQETITAEVVYYKDNVAIFKGHMPFWIIANDDYYDRVFYFKGEFSEEKRKEWDEEAFPVPKKQS